MRFFSLRPIRFFAFVVLAIALTAGFYKVWRYEGIRFFGDEPHYLVMTRNLIQTGNLDLTNIYAHPARYQDFYTGTLDPHLSRGQSAGPARYSLHGAGIPIMLVPIMKYLGLRGVVLLMCGWATLVCILGWVWTWRHTRSRAASSLSVVVLAVSISFLGLAGHVFPDLVIAGLLLAAVLNVTSQKLQWYNYLIVSLVIGVMPWIHVKMLFYAATIGLIALWRYWQQRSKGSPNWARLGLLIIPASLLLVGYEASLLHWYGTLIPSQAFASSGQLFQISPAVSLGAGLFDATKGLLTNNPAFAFMFAGLALWYKQDRKTLLIVLVLILPTLALQSTFGDWWGGWSPTGRYWLEFLPLLLPGLGYCLVLVTNWVWRVLFAITLLIQIKFTQIYLQAKLPWPLPGDKNPVWQWLSVRHHIDVTGFLPNFALRPTAKSWLETLAAAASIAILAGFSLYCASQPGHPPKTTAKKSS